MSKWTMIVVHGVGNATPGSILEESSKGMPGIAGTRADLVLNGCLFPTLDVANHPAIDRIIEVNWSDVASPQPTTLALADYVVRIVAALLHLATRLPGAGCFGKAYRFSFETLLVYCLYPALVAMLLFVTPSPPGRWSIALLAPLAVAGMAWYLTRFGRPLWAGMIWAALMLAGGLALVTGCIPAHVLVEAFTRVYVLSQQLVGALLFVTLIVVACHGSMTGERRIAVAALLCFPLFIVSAIGAVLWALAFAAVRSLSREPTLFEQWQRLYANALHSWHYDLQQVEWGFAGLIGVVGAWLIVVAYRCWRRTGTPGSTPTTANRDAGTRARRGVASALLFGAAGYVVLLAGLAMLAWHQVRFGSNLSVLEIYVISALRVVPYLALMVGPLSLVTGIAVDVLFYIADHHSTWTANILRERFAAALAHATTEESRRVAVIAHSQGSVMALDVIGQLPPGRQPSVFTAGSPTESLYATFLGSTFATRAETLGQDTVFTRPASWTNFSRSADYVGGAQRDGDAQEVILDGGTHTGYWILPAMWSRIAKGLQ